MLKSKAAFTGILSFLSFAAFAAMTWYLPFIVPTSYALDKDQAWSAASNIFDQNQLSMMASGAMKKGDLVDAQYQDGTIVQFKLGDPADCNLRCTWTDDPFDTSQSPKILQGRWPGPKTPRPQVVTPGVAFIDPGMSVDVESSTQVWSITISQYGGNCDICNGTYLGETQVTGTGGGGGGGGGGAGGTGGTGVDPCDDDDDDDCLPTDTNDDD